VIVPPDRMVLIAERSVVVPAGGSSRSSTELTTIARGPGTAAMTDEKNALHRRMKQLTRIPVFMGIHQPMLALVSVSSPQQRQLRRSGNIDVVNALQEAPQSRQYIHEKPLIVKVFLGGSCHAHCSIIPASFLQALPQAPPLTCGYSSPHSLHCRHPHGTGSSRCQKQIRLQIRLGRHRPLPPSRPHLASHRRWLASNTTSARTLHVCSSEHRHPGLLATAPAAAMVTWRKKRNHGRPLIYQQVQRGAWPRAPSRR